jgi:histone acetyltransferase MYST1
MADSPQLGEQWNVSVLSGGEETSYSAASSSSKRKAATTKELKLTEILDRRPLYSHRDKDIETLPASCLEFYVHYIGVDRRMDEWVKYERLHPIKPPPPKGGGSTKRRASGSISISATRIDTGSGGSGLVGVGGGGGAGTGAAHTSHLSDHDDMITRVKNIQSIALGPFHINAWYYSPYPQDVCSNAEEKLFICEYCLTYMDRASAMRRHTTKCRMRSPPGREIYREKGLSCFEVDGKDHKVYCQNLCLLSKLFLDHKTLYYDVDPFLFYILCEVDAEGCHVVGYFSKEKNSQENYNLSCILTYPPYQRKGYGKFLISLSYELTKREEKIGSPEKPISDLGMISYKSYWTCVLLEALTGAEAGRKNVTTSIRALSTATGVAEDDVVTTLQDLSLLTHWKGQTFISISKDVLKQASARERKVRLANPACLVWTGPPPVGRDK